MMKTAFGCAAAVVAAAMGASAFGDTRHVDPVGAEMATYRAASNAWAQAWAEHQKTKGRKVRYEGPRQPKFPLFSPEGETEKALAKRRLWHEAEGVTFPVRFGKSAPYRLWLRHYRTADLHSRLAVRLVAPNGVTCRYQILDRVEDLNVRPEEEGRKFRTGLPGGFVWTSLDVNVEVPGEYQAYVWLSQNDGRRDLDWGKPVFALADAWVSDDPAFDPAKDPKESPEDVPLAAPEGFRVATHRDLHVSLNTSVKDPQKRLPLTTFYCYCHYDDSAVQIELGNTDGVGSGQYKDSWKYGCCEQYNADMDRGCEAMKALQAKYPFDRRKPVGPGNIPYGRAGHYDAKTGAYVHDNEWSDCFDEYVEIRRKECEKAVQAVIDKEGKDGWPQLGMWWTAWEQCGRYDYGDWSRAKFREFLKESYGSLAALNAAWHTEYRDFAEIEPARWDDCCGPDAKTNFLERCRARANFIDFRDFCSKSYAKLIAVKTEAVMKLDRGGPGGRPRHVSSNFSANNLTAVMWMRWRPLSFEDGVNIILKGSDMVGYDNYGADDLMGCYYELFDSFGCGEVRPMIREGSTHAASPYLIARSQWGNFAKGMRGMSCFTFQENGAGELTKFGMSDMYDDAAPRPKLAAIYDNFRAMCQMEGVLSETRRERAVKPVGIYYSAVCNTLTEKPYASIFDCGVDNYMRVYELIHANGYPVSFVTDRHFRERPDWVKNFSAIFFIDATYIPTDVQEKVKAYVEAGGHVVADAQSGTYDGHGFPCDGFTEWLGIRPVQEKKVDENEAAAKLSFGYSAYSFDVINRDELYKTARELKNPPFGPTHPVNRMSGKVMFSALGGQKIRNVAGTTLLSENNGGPVWVIREHGKGTSSFFAGYLGTIYGAGCTEYEFSDKHSENSPYRFIDAYLAYAGAKKAEVNDLPGDAAYYTRFESPLTDAKGNAAMGVVSEEPNGCERSFRVKYAMPKGFREPKMALAAVSGTRAIRRVPFAWDAGSRELSLRLGGFRCWTEALALNDAPPIVSVEPVDPRRDAYGLVDFRPGDEVSFRVKVYNPSPRTLAAGEVELRLSDGWFCDREKAALPEIGAYGESAELVFRVKAPALNCARRVKPVNFVYRSAGVESAPAVELVWFQKAPLEPGRPVFGVK